MEIQAEVYMELEFSSDRPAKSRTIDPAAPSLEDFTEICMEACVEVCMRACMESSMDFVFSLCVQPCAGKYAEKFWKLFFIFCFFERIPACPWLGRTLALMFCLCFPAFFVFPPALCACCRSSSCVLLFYKFFFSSAVVVCFHLCLFSVWLFFVPALFFP